MARSEFFAVVLSGDQPSPILGIGNTREEALEDAKGPGAGPVYPWTYAVMPCTEGLYKKVAADGGDVVWARWGELLMLGEEVGKRGKKGGIIRRLTGKLKRLIHQ